MFSVVDLSRRRGTHQILFEKPVRKTFSSRKFTKPTLQVVSSKNYRRFNPTCLCWEWEGKTEHLYKYFFVWEVSRLDRFCSLSNKYLCPSIFSTISFEIVWPSKMKRRQRLPPLFFIKTWFFPYQTILDILCSCKIMIKPFFFDLNLFIGEFRASCPLNSHIIIIIYQSISSISF